MRIGQTVEVLDAFEKKQVKRVASVDVQNVYVCTDEEYQLANAEKREPICIGFPRQFVLGVVDK